jgi:hypothetical protein
MGSELRGGGEVDELGLQRTGSTFPVGTAALESLQ